MGKATGFLEYPRAETPERSPLERIRDFDEFHGALSEEERRKQGARCMNCGVPFCQSGMMLHGMATGCPLHNLIPEWNDEVYHGNTWHALSRLLKTNNFPEFTGRVCPALCEVACLCGVNDRPVTIKENERSIIEKGFTDGYMPVSYTHLDVYKRQFEQSGNDTYVASLSSRTIVYKGMFLVNQLREFYSDLQDEDYVSAMALVHSRFSTNTNPSWERAHPNRFLLHNGEINTIRGNVDRMLAREETMFSPDLQANMDKILPVVDDNGSDSAIDRKSTRLNSSH